MNFQILNTNPKSKMGIADWAHPFSVILFSLTSLFLLFSTEVLASKDKTCLTVLKGLLPESVHVRGLVLANQSHFQPMIDYHSLVIGNLPQGSSKLYYVANPDLVSKHFLEELKTAAPDDARNIIPIRVKAPGDWIRDYGPQVVKGKNGEYYLATFRYTRPDLGDTNLQKQKVATALSKKIGLPLKQSNLEIQWGALWVDENARLFISDKMLDFNEGLTKLEVEAELKNILQVDEVIWLPALPEENTGHLDMYSKYVGNNRVLISASRSKTRKEMLKATKQKLEDLGLSVIEVPMAENKPNSESTTFTYTNSIIFNDTVFVPQFADTNNRDLPFYNIFSETDKKARSIYQRLGFSPEKIIGVNSATLNGWGGSLHCLTCQLRDDRPLAKSRKTP